MDTLKFLGEGVQAGGGDQIPRVTNVSNSGGSKTP